jgi:dTDP-glucose 4,6-dehydratase
MVDYTCILVTGGSGFIGSHLVDLLIEKGYRVVNYDILSYTVYPDANEDVKMNHNYSFVKGDILSRELLEDTIKSRKVDAIIHLAAETHVDNSFGNSIKFTTVNILGTHILLEVALRCGIKRFIHVSTDEVYGETNKLAHEIDSVLEPTNPYAATKASAEMIAKSYLRSFKLPVIITRGNNVYGPRQYPEKLIPKTICRLIDGKNPCIHGNGTNERNYLYVTDVARAFLVILERGSVGEVYNIGTQISRTNLTTVKDISRLMGGHTNIEFVHDRKFNDKRYQINNDKIQSLGWVPDIIWEDGLNTTIEWYSANMNKWEKLESALRPHPII